MENNERDADITVEHSTPVELEIQDHLNQYYHDQDKIESRLQQLDEEMDIETYPYKASVPRYQLPVSS